MCHYGILTASRGDADFHCARNEFLLVHASFSFCFLLIKNAFILGNVNLSLRPGIWDALFRGLFLIPVNNDLDVKL